MTLLLNRELVSRVKLCLFSVFPAIVKDCPKIRNLPKIFLRSFENVDPELDLEQISSVCVNSSFNQALVSLALVDACASIHFIC